MAKNSFATPDFAYPKTVCKNAESEYERALSAGDGASVLLASIQLNVAECLRDASSGAREALKRYECLGNKLQAPWNALALLLEARLYADVYQANSWQYNNRELPLDHYPEDMTAWSAEMFAARTLQAVTEAMRAASDVRDMPLAEVSKVLVNYDSAVKCGMTLGDFVELKGASLLSEFVRGNDEPLRFGDEGNALTPRDRCREMRNALVSEGMNSARNRGNVPIGAMFSRKALGYITYSPRHLKFLEECYDLYGDTEWGAQFVAEYVSARYLNPRENASGSAPVTNEDRRKALDILKKYNDKFPTPKVQSRIAYQISNLTAPGVTLGFPEQTMTGRDWKCTLEMSNLYDFNILIYKIPERYSDDSDGSRIKLSTLKSYGKIIGVVPVKHAGAVPDVCADTVNMKGLEPGCYALEISKTRDASGLIKGDDNSSCRTMRVSDLSYFISSSAEKGTRLFVVNAENQKPVRGAKVKCTGIVYRGAVETSELVTDHDGSVVMPEYNCKFNVSFGGNIVNGTCYNYGRGVRNEEEEPVGSVLTDLSIYKPGDRVGYVGMLGVRKGHSMSEQAGRDVRFELRDANWQLVDSLISKTDAYGRSDGGFALPLTGLLGTYQIRMMQGDREVARRGFEVADYKSPTFRVVTEKMEGNFRPGDTLVLRGKAMTYAGMPVSGGKVAYKVTYSPWRRWWGMSRNEAEFNGTATTDEEGGFEISLPTGTIVDTQYEKGLFSLSVAVTDGAGETREAPAVRFSLMSAYSLNVSVPDRLRAGSGEMGCSVGVTDMLGYPVEKKIYYTVENAKGIDVAHGECRAGTFDPGWDTLPSGSYRITFSLNSDMKDNSECGNVTAGTILWRRDDKVPPVESALWVPLRRYELKPGQSEVEIPVGSSYSDSYIFAEIGEGGKELRHEWFTVSDGFARLRLAAPASDSRWFVNLVGMHDLDSETAQIEVIPGVQLEKVKIEAESFRDKLEPGAGETWKFRFTCGGRPMSGRPVMAVMSNAALNAIVPFAWSFNPYGGMSWYPGNFINDRTLGDIMTRFGYRKNYKERGGAGIAMPEFNTYGYGLYARRKLERVYATSYMASAGEIVETLDEENGLSFDNAEPMASANVKVRGTRKYMKQAAASTETAEMESADSDEGQGPLDSAAELRPVECPLAFFMPSLTTDENGEASVDFSVPQFNGTWQFQLAGYTSDLKGGVLIRDAVASKKVMVQMNAPRFLRTGDKARISATLFNNSDKALPVEGSVVILDADGKVLREKRYAAEELNPSGQRVVTIDYDVPGDLSSVQVRAYAMGDNYRDGEGTVVEVLPSSTPVLEARPFYAGPGASVIRAEMPANAENATVTLQYCGNPVWECVTALPEILKPESTNILAQTNALYGNAIAMGLIKQYPRLGEALRTFAAPENDGDSTLVSNLQKNDNIKVVSLGNTPWVNDASDETRRMRSLVKYCDTKEAQAAVDAIMKVLADRQNNNGGWSWCPDMPSSEFVTGRVLLHFAMLKGMGYLPAGAEKMAVPAFSFVDKELVKDWEESKRKYFSTAGLLNYLYVKSFFPDVKDSGTFGLLRARALKAIEEEWKEFDIYDKATAVTLEYRLRNTSLAMSILESLRQFATVTPDKGMCFENLRGVWSGWNPLITTAQVLEAYGEAAPRDAAVDQLRQWLLMSKQTMDWGRMRGTAEVIQAILSTGGDWTAPSESAAVTVGGKVIDVPARAAITDSFTLTLTPEQTRSGDISIHKTSAGPAWGGVVSQYVAPVLDVKNEGTPQLRIEKNIYSIQDGTAVTGNLKVGDKVRVTLTITTDRDMDYVAVTDSRSACLEPVGQLSGYTSSDGLWFYREVRDESTNLFIPFLGKGTHVVSYECYVDRAGEYTLGIAQAQSQYAPVISAHSAGVKLTVK